MKYSININQKSAIDSGLGLDLTDLALLDFIKDFTALPRCKTITDNGVIYYWIAHKAIIDSMPLLGITTTRGVIGRINKLVEKELLVKYAGENSANMSFYAYGKNFEKLFFCYDEEARYEQPFTGMNENSGGCTEIHTSDPKNEERYEQPFTPGMNDRSPYYNINNNNINNNILKKKESLLRKASEKEKSFSHPSPENEETDFEKFDADTQVENSLSEEKEKSCAKKEKERTATKLAEYFNETTKGVFGIVRTPLGEQRRKMLMARVREHGESAFCEAVEKAAASSFLKGQNTRGWSATFDWLIKPTNFEKVLTGNYDNANDINTNRKQQHESIRISEEASGGNTRFNYIE